MSGKYAYYKSLGICPECGKRKAREGKVHCAECAAKRSAYFRKHKDNRNRANREFVKRRKENGLCKKCGKPVDNGIFCDDCRYIRNVKRRITEYRKRNGTWTGRIFDEVTLNKISLGVLHKLGWI